MLKGLFRKQFGEIVPFRGRLSTGEKGERAAARYLSREQQFQILARNWRNPWNRREEIDLVCRDGEILVFVEVKTRTGDEVLEGYHAVNAAKRRILRSAGQAYLKRYAPADRALSYRLDVVVVCMMPTGKVGEIAHFRNLPLFS